MSALAEREKKLQFSFFQMGDFLLSNNFQLNCCGMNVGLWRGEWSGLGPTRLEGSALGHYQIALGPRTYMSTTMCQEHITSPGHV